MPLDAAPWNLSCLDWEQRILQRTRLCPDLPLFEEEAAAAVEFFNKLALPDVPGKPLLEQACGEWFRDIVRAVFGSRDPATNVRHIREFFVLVGKGNSKTTYSAGLMLVALLMNVRPRAEFLFVGPTQAISDIAFDVAKGMIENDPDLTARFHVREHRKEIRDRVTGARVRVKTFDLKILTGPKPVGVLIDELHLLGKNAHTTKVLRQIRGGLEKNTEGFLIFITTQSDERPTGAFKDELQIARAIRDGRMPGRMLPILYEFPLSVAKDEEKWRKPQSWAMVMPNLGRSLQLGSLADDFRTESEKGRGAVQIWASQHLSIEIGVGQHSDDWAGASLWQRRAHPELTLDRLLERSEVVVAGIDGGGLDDLHGLTLIGREAETKRWLSWSRAWASAIVLERRKDIASKLRDLQGLGDLVIFEEPNQDIEELVAILAGVRDAQLFPEKHAVGVDTFGIGATVDALAEADIAGDMVIGISQGWKLTGAIKTAERKLLDGSLHHGGQVLMEWCVGNAKTVQVGNALTINKAVSGSAKIDPLMALFNAVTLMSMNPEAGGGSIYDDASLWEKRDGTVRH